MVQFCGQAVSGVQEPASPISGSKLISKLIVCRFQVHEQARDERPRSVRPYDHHECRHLSLLPERGMVQISILPSIFFLLLIWVSFFLYPPSHC